MQNVTFAIKNFENISPFAARVINTQCTVNKFVLSHATIRNILYNPLSTM
ncbi:hypothetical protein GVAMD_0392 [Gardnerella vaginalis AMD]|nr:hypothetical protein GVAMD_0392 [Gardnerella vaginalis AMD]